MSVSVGSLGKSAAARVSARLISSALQAVSLVLIARAVGPQAFGTFAVVCAVGYVVSSATTMGTSVRVLRLSAEPGNVQRLAAGFFAIRAAGAAVTLSVCLALGVWLGPLSTVVAAALLVTTDNLADYSQSYLSGQHRQFAAAAQIVLQRLCVACAAAVVVAVGETTLWLLLPAFAVVALVSVAEPLRGLCRPDFRASFRGSLGYWAAGLSSNASQAEIPVLSGFVAAPTVGVYSIAARLTNPLTILVSALQALMIPELTRTLGTARHTRLFRMFLKWTLAYAILLSALSPIGAMALVHILGPAYSDAHVYIIVMIIAAALSSVAQVFQAGVISLGLPHRAAAAVMGGVLLGLLNLAILMSTVGEDYLWICPLVTHSIVLLAMSYGYVRPRAAR